MTNNEAREAFKSMGLTYSDIGSKEFFDLVKRLDEALPSHKFEMKVSRKPKSHAPKIVFDDFGRMKKAYIRCDSNYFSGREAISFNADGFIGFAGWADKESTQIFLEVFLIWVDNIAKNKLATETEYLDQIILARNNEIKNLKNDLELAKDNYKLMKSNFDDLICKKKKFLEALKFCKKKIELVKYFGKKGALDEVLNKIDEVMK